MFDARLTQLRGFPAERVTALDIFLHRYAVRGGGYLGVGEVGTLLEISDREAMRVLIECVRLSVLLLTKDGGSLYFEVPAYKPDTVAPRDALLAFRALAKSYE